MSAADPVPALSTNSHRLPASLPHRDPASDIRSERLTLCSPRLEDLAEAQRWGSDEELVSLYGGPPGDLARQAGGYVLAIFDRVGAGWGPGRLIGLIGLTGDTWAMRSAELRVLIGLRSCWGRGYGREAITRFLNHVFAATDLDFIYLRVFRRNTRAIRCYESCGFRRSGRLEVRADSRYTEPPPVDDLVLMTFVRAGAARVARNSRGSASGSIAGAAGN